MATVEAWHQSYSSALADACINGSCCRCRCCVSEAEAEADTGGRCASRRSRRHIFDRRCQKSEPDRSTPQRQLLRRPLYMSPSTNGLLSGASANGGEPYATRPSNRQTHTRIVYRCHRCFNSPRSTSRPLALRQTRWRPVAAHKHRHARHAPM